MTRFTLVMLVGSFLALEAATPLFAQSPETKSQAAGKTVYEGTVVSATGSTVVIRDANGEYRLFAFDRDTARPAQIPPRATVSVEARPAAEGETPVATRVRVTAMPPAPSDAAAKGGAGQQVPDEPVPPAIRRAETSIERQARRYRIGVRAGAALDPELIIFGGQAQLGPFFSDQFWARPNVEFGFGEVTDFIGLNIEGIYRVPVTSRESRWSFFMGAGPALNFTKLGFSTPDNADEQIDFDQFHFDVGLNLLAGVQSREGMFVELKATAYSTAHLRFIVGYNF